MAGDLPAPKLLAFIICDQVYTDSATGKTSLLGMFSNINSRTYPAKHPRLCVHVALWDGRGKYKGKMELVPEGDGASGKPIFAAQGEIVFPDPLVTVMVNFEINDLPFPAPGQYMFNFYCDDNLVANRPVRALLAEG